MGRDVSAYAARVRGALPAFFDPVEVVPSLPSTMERAAELARAGAPEGATVVADLQTAGRGRLGRTWSAPPGTSILASVVLRPRLPAAAAWLVAAVAGVALAGAAREVLGPGQGITLKWPNDLLLNGGKVAGLLAEAEAEGERLAWVLLGMGVNVGQQAADFPPELAGRATSLALAAGAPVDRVAVLRAWGPRFLQGYGRLVTGDVEGVLSDYRERLGTLGRRVRVQRLGAPAVVGTAVDLTGTGALVVRTDRGERVVVTAADVEHLRDAG